MAGGTISLNSTANWATYCKTKASFTDAYKCNAQTIRLPYVWNFKITLPAKESDGVTASTQTFTYLNAFHLPIKVTYSGNATA